MVFMNIDRIKVCLNGTRRPGEHPGLPVTPAQLAEAAVAAVAAGAEAIHMHPRDAQGNESLAMPDVEAAVLAVRQACPTTPIGVSTGLWIVGGDPAARLDAVTAWSSVPASLRPDFASVNLDEPGFAPVVRTLISLGVGVEAGIWSIADADALAESGLAEQCTRLLVEVLAVPAGAGRVPKCGAPRSSIPMNRIALGPSQQTASTRAAATPGINSRRSSKAPLENPIGSPLLSSSALRTFSGASLRNP